MNSEISSALNFFSFRTLYAWAALGGSPNWPAYDVWKVILLNFSRACMVRKAALSWSRPLLGSSLLNFFYPLTSIMVLMSLRPCDRNGSG